MKHLHKVLLCAALLSAMTAVSQQPKPMSVDIVQAEQLFFANNFMRLAKQYDVDVAQAQMIQSKLYPNPEVSFDVLRMKVKTTIIFQWEVREILLPESKQLIVLGGKRKAKINLAKLDKKMAEAELADVTRNLQAELWQSFFTVYHQQKLIVQYDNLLNRLETLIGNYDKQVQKNNIPLKDMVRLKSVYVKINNDKSEESQTLISEQQKLNLLLGITANIQAVYPDETAQKFSDKLLSYEDILKQAETNRPDFQLANTSLESADVNLKFQRKSVIPDLTLRGGYNQQGDAFFHQANVGIGFPIPFFDRNQGNISAAKIEQNRAKTGIAYKQIEIENEVFAAYRNYVRSVDEYKKINQMVNTDFGLVFDGINSNFIKGNVSMMEFADFFESYNEAQAEVERVKQQLAIAAAQINLVSGTQNF